MNQEWVEKVVECNIYIQFKTMAAASVKLMDTSTDPTLAFDYLFLQKISFQERFDAVLRYSTYIHTVDNNK